MFCRIVEGTSPARVVHEGELTLAFLDINPAGRGHTLVIPRSHLRTLAGTPPHVAGAVFAAASDVARLIQERLAPDGLTVLQANEAAGWQEVFHLHVHLIPRWEGDRLARPWVPTPAAGDVLDQVHAELVPR